MSPHYLVKCRTLSSDWRSEGMLHSSKCWWLWKKAGCGLALVALKRTGCDVWQMERQTSNLTASNQSGQLLYGYMLPVFFATDQLHRPSLCAETECRNIDSYSICVKMKRVKNCAFYMAMRWHFSGVMDKGVTVCFLLR